MNGIQGYITIEGDPVCSHCRQRVLNHEGATWLFRGGRFIVYCGDPCHEADTRKWLAAKDERLRVNRAIGERDLLRELCPAESGTPHSL